jgi:hypothetical protein
MALTYDGTSGITFNDGSQIGSASQMGIRNRIINGHMIIDQRNAGASGTSTGYTIDRWQYYGTQNSKITWQQKNSANSAISNYESNSAPTGFVNSVKLTTTSAYTPGASEEFSYYQKIEGLNVFDLDWGLSTAASVTLSFWVKSSLTGTFGGAIQDSSGALSYPYSYVINSANTWEKKTILIAGPTSGTWLKNTGIGLVVNFCVGAGATISGTPGAWTSGYYASATGATQVVATNSATWYVTGVQLEKGSVATPFDLRLYPKELLLCQRYCWVSYTTSGNGGPLVTGAAYNTTSTQVALQLPVPMRTTPSATTVPNGSSVWCQSYVGASGTTTNTAPSIQSDQNNYQNLRITVDGLSGMTAGQATWTFTPANAKLILSAEL